MTENHHPLVTYPHTQDAVYREYIPPEAPQDEEAFPISITQIKVILRSYWKISAAIFVVVLSLAVIGMEVVPKSYTGIATMLVEFDSLDPLAAKELADFGPGSYLPTQIELMQSDSVLDAVIDRLSLASRPEYTSGHQGGDSSLRDWISVKLRNSLEVEPGRAGSQLIYITASASSANMAADIANAVADSFLAQHFSDTAGPSAERAQRYGEELTSLKRKVDEAQSALSDFRKTAGPIDLDSKTDVEAEVLSSLEHRLLDARNSLRSNQARSGGQRDMTTSILTSTSMSNLRDEGAKLATKMAQLRTEYGPNHPDVIALQSQIDANKAAQASAQSAYMNATSSDIQVTSREVESLESAVASQRAKVFKIRQYRDQAVKYQLEFESAQSVYKKALDGYDQQKFAATGQNSRIHVASRARPPVKASKPNLKKFLAAGFLGGVALALLVPFLLELPRRRIRCVDDVERDMKIPVLIELPSISKRHIPAGAHS